MSKILPWMILAGLATVLLTISFYQPHLLNDDNEFLKVFVRDQLLATLGFILAVTLASAASLHFEFNRIEDETGKPLTRSRRSVRRSAYSLIVMFVAGGFVAILKPLLPEPAYNSAVANSIAILIVYFNLSVLLDLTRTVFGVPAVSVIKARDNDKSA